MYQDPIKQGLTIGLTTDNLQQYDKALNNTREMRWCKWDRSFIEVSPLKGLDDGYITYIMACLSLQRRYLPLLNNQVEPLLYQIQL